jgi:hypothetical protein
MPITVTLDFNGFYFLNFTFPPSFYFSNSDYENLPDFTFLYFSSQDFLFKATDFFPVSSHKLFSLKIHTNWLMKVMRTNFKAR